MSEPDSQTEPTEKQLRRTWRWSGLLALALLLTLAIMAAAYYQYYPGQLGPAQPVAFSHRVHAAEKRISCVFCHAGVVDTPRAGVPPVETCMLCHSRIIIHHPQIERVRDYYARNEPIPWQRVNDLPEHAYFNHQRHVRKGVDCGRCHGDVAGMDRVSYYQKFEMGFCVQCHRDEGASHDCLICHR